MNDPLAIYIPTLIDSVTTVRAAAAHMAVHNGSRPGSQAPALNASAITPHAAARGYNQLVFEGRLVEDPALRQAGTGRLYCRVMVVQDQPDRNGQSGTQGVDVVCFDERASRFAGRFRRGDYAIFIGRMTIERRRDQKGQFHTNVSLHLERVLGHRPMRR